MESILSAWTRTMQGLADRLAASRELIAPRVEFGGYDEEQQRFSFTVEGIPSTPLGILDRDCEPGDRIMVPLGGPPDQPIPVLRCDQQSLDRLDELYGKGSEVAGIGKAWIHDEAARKFMEYLDPMSWFEDA